MPKVSNLKIELQKGTTDKYYASWGFSAPKEETNTSIKVGSLVSIKPGSKYYTGVDIPDWVESQKWKVKSIKGDRAVLGKNVSGTNDINSPVSTKYLTTSGSSSSSGSQVTKDTVDKFEVTWYYDTGNNTWFKGTTSSEDGIDAAGSITVRTSSFYTPPDNASIIKVYVKPVAKNKKEGDKEVPYWTGTQVSCTYNIGTLAAPEVPPSPAVEIEKYTLTATVDNVSDYRTHEIEFEITNGTKVINSKDANRYVEVLTCRASYSSAVTAGGEYRVRCRAIHLNGSTKIPSEWTAYTSVAKTMPATPSGITVCRANSETSVYLEWKEEPTATKYDIEYTTNKNYFDGSDKTTTKTGIEFTHFELTGLESGVEYFFRIRATNDKGNSGWSGIKSVVIGKDPAAPTTWSSSTTVITGEDLTLYWVHNSEDNSNQTLAELELHVLNSGETVYERTYTLKQNENIEDEYIKYVALGEVEEGEEEENWSCDIKTAKFVEGVKIEWRVRTAGITKAYGDWSVQRTVDIYAPPTLDLNIITSEGTSIDTLTAFPFYVSALAGPNTQLPIGYHVTVTANESYETVDRVGNTVLINAGDVVYTKYFDITDALMVEFSANNIDLENGVRYSVNCTVSMDSGLSAEASVPFDVSWTDELYEPNVSIFIDDDSYSAQIRPFCRDNDGTLVEDIMLAVYRREFDGGYTEIASNLDNTKNAVVIDPHPPLDYARYRIVATTKSTGAVSFYDAPAYPVGGKSVIIQWDEDWQSFDSINATAESQEQWSGSLLKLHYNIDVSDNNSPDVSFIKYIGRSHPVGYYGTQLGASATWNTVIEKDDEETIFALRRLSQWMGDVYVREPSGTGYWANVRVSFSQKHKDLTIPVTLDITRVEGGI